MKSRKPDGEPDLLRAQSSQVLNLRHPLLRLSEKMDWTRLEAEIDGQYRPGPGQPPLPTRLMAGLHYLKHVFDLGGERLAALWLENPYWQCFCGHECLQHELPLHPTSLVRWRERMGDRLESMLEHSLHVARQMRRAARGWMKRRAAVEPTIGRLKSDRRLSRNRLKGSQGDQADVVLAAAGCDFAELLAGSSRAWRKSGEFSCPAPRITFCAGLAVLRHERETILQG